MVFDNSEGVMEYNVTQSYFHSPEPIQWPCNEDTKDYADPVAKITHGSNEWTHSLGDIINALIGAGLRIEFLHEFPECFYQATPMMKQDKDGWWRVEGSKIPHTFSLKATKSR